MKITFNILYWNGFDSENRIKNINFTWDKIKQFSKYCNDNELENKCLLFDFSHNKILNESIHIPYINGEYKRSEKINKVLEYNYNNYKPELICFLDSDIFFEESQYTILFNLINTLTPNNVFVSSVLDIMDIKSVDYVNKKLINPSFRNRLIPGLGAFFIINFDDIFKIGGFDERFLVWGGEDDDISYRLDKKGFKISLAPIKLYHLPHISMQDDAHQNPQYHLQCRLIGNNDIITKYSLISKKYLGIQ